MAFWVTRTEPLRKNRFKFTISGGTSGMSGYSWTVKKCDKPSFKTSEIIHKFGNHNFIFPGRVEWNPINVTFASVDNNDIALMKLLGLSGFTAPSKDSDALKFATKNKINEVLGTVSIEQIDSDGNALETWALVNPFFTNIKFGDLSYDSEEVIDIEVTIRYDTATITTAAANTEI